MISLLLISAAVRVFTLSGVLSVAEVVIVVEAAILAIIVVGRR